MKLNSTNYYNLYDYYAFNDAEEKSISVTDVKHYFYCPKIIYFDKVIHADAILGSQQQESKKIHKEKEKKDKRRMTMLYDDQFPKCVKMFNMHIYSTSLCIDGIIDCVIKNGSDEYIPVDYKKTFSKATQAWTDHKYHLTAYSLLIEEQYSTIVRRGFIYYIPENLAVEIKMSENMKSYLRRSIKAIKNIVKSGEEPIARVPKSRCTGGCGYLWICGGICNREK
jgi:CRISPR-associated exonuclease Cas4